MTAPATPASRKSAERQRRKDAGEVRVETYLEPHLLAVVDRFAKSQGSRSEALRCIVWNVERMDPPVVITGPSPEELLTVLARNIDRASATLPNPPRIG